MAIKINGDNSTSAVGLSGGDDNSGIKPGTNQVEIVTGGTARVTVNDSQTTISKLSVTDTVTAAGSAIICGDNPNGAVNVGGRMRNIGQLQLTSNGGTLFQGMDQGNATPNVQIEANGQAEFKNRVKIQRTDSDTSAALLIVNAAGSANEHIFYGNGQASFGGGETAIGASGELNTNQNIVLNSGGKGIKFPASNTGNADANTLDDYEEGTFTPTITAGYNGVSFNTGYPNGNYTKIGDLVFIVISMYFSSTGHVTSARPQVGGLPFTAHQSPIHSFGGVLNNSFTTIELTSHVSTSWYIAPNGVVATLFANNGNSFNSYPNANASNDWIQISGCYKAA